MLNKVLNVIMRRRTNVEDDTESDTIDDEATGTDETGSEKKVSGVGASFYRLSCKLLPKRCRRLCFLILNIATFFAGLIAVTSSWWMILNAHLMSLLGGQRLLIRALLAVGVFATVTSFIGILGFVKKRRRYLTTYIVFQSICLSAIFACGILSITFYEWFIRKVFFEMLHGIDDYKSLNWVTEAWDNTQSYLKCCGILSPQDWAKQNMKIPRSCCAVSLDQCLHMTDLVAYKQGCFRRSLDLIKLYVNTVVLCVLLTSIGLVTGLFLAVGLRRNVKKKGRARVDSRS